MDQMPADGGCHPTKANDLVTVFTWYLQYMTYSLCRAYNVPRVSSLNTFKSVRI